MAKVFDGPSRRGDAGGMLERPIRGADHAEQFLVLGFGVDVDECGFDDDTDD
jgi:hypothetical protein